MSISCRSRRPVAQSWLWNAAVRRSHVMMLDFGAKGTLLALLWTAWMGSPASMGRLAMHTFRHQTIATT
jgi:hypothetical protein